MSDPTNLATEELIAALVERGVLREKRRKPWIPEYPNDPTRSGWLTTADYEEHKYVSRWERT